MPGNLHNNTTLSGSAMAVLVGVVLIIAPWFVPIGFFAKLVLSIVGIILIFIGVKS